MTQETALKPIVVAVDFSQESESALLVAAGLAETTSATPFTTDEAAATPSCRSSIWHGVRLPGL